MVTETMAAMAQVGGKGDSGRQGIVSMSHMPAIHVKNLHKSYGTAHVLDGVSLDVGAGEFYALTGPNGSESTLTAIIASMVSFDGTVEVFGERPAKAWRTFGYAPRTTSRYLSSQAERTWSTSQASSGTPAEKPTHWRMSF